MRSAALPLALTLPLAALAGCTSTQEKSEQIAQSLGPVQQEKGLEITEESDVVEVVSTTLLTDKTGSAVVVTLHNDSDEDLTNVPVAIDVLDANGQSVYANDIPGLEPALTEVPLIEAGSDVDWVHNQILATGRPDTVDVRVGKSNTTLAGELPDIEVSEPELETDPVSGVAATGVAINHTSELHKRLLLYGVARDGEEIVAAGRGALVDMKPERRLHYDVFFVGDPKAGEVTVSSFPTLDSQ
jgi:hypothetical protein